MDSRWIGLALAGGLVWAGYHGHPRLKIAGFIIGGLWLFAQVQSGGVLGQMNVRPVPAPNFVVDTRAQGFYSGQLLGVVNGQPIYRGTVR